MHFEFLFPFLGKKQNSTLNAPQTRQFRIIWNVNALKCSTLICSSIAYSVWYIQNKAHFADKDDYYFAEKLFE
jgi:hypothetical protein